MRGSTWVQLPSNGARPQHQRPLHQWPHRQKPQHQRPKRFWSQRFWSQRFRSQRLRSQRLRSQRQGRSASGRSVTGRSVTGRSATPSRDIAIYQRLAQRRGQNRPTPPASGADGRCFGPCFAIRLSVCQSCPAAVCSSESADANRGHAPCLPDRRRRFRRDDRRELQQRSEAAFGYGLRPGGGTAGCVRSAEARKRKRKIYEHRRCARKCHGYSPQC